MLDNLRAFAQLIRTVRSDGWENVLTGLGTGRDKTQYGYFRASCRISDQELTDLFNHHDLARRIVSLRPSDCYREGFKVEIKDDNEQAEEINKAIKERGIVNQFRRATVFGRLQGGGLIIGGLDDGQSQDKPLDEENISRLRYLTFLDKRYVTVLSYYEDPEADKFMEPEVYQISAPNGKMLAAVHESRCIRFGGAETDERTARELGGWDFSVLQNCYNTLRAFENNWQAINVLISDASQGVMTIKGLINTLATPGGRAAMQTRMEIMDMTRSVARAVVLDADHGEGFTRVSTSFAGLPDLLDRGMMRMSAAAEVPVTRLFGRSAAGMNATGEGDEAVYYDGIKAEQGKEVEPKLRKVVTWICKSKDGPTQGKVPEEFTLTFPSLWQPTPKEQAETEKTFAERDKIMLDGLVWLPEEVALARARGGPNGPVEIDEDMRETVLENEKKMAENPPVIGAPVMGPDGKPLPPGVNPDGTPQDPKNPLPGQAPPGGGPPPPVPGGGNAPDQPGPGDPPEDPEEDT